MKVTVCIGSSCHIKGSRSVVEQLQNLIAGENLSDKIELGGSFCMGKCQQGVCVTVDGDFQYQDEPGSGIVGSIEKDGKAHQSQLFLAAGRHKPGMNSVAFLQ